MQNKVSEGRVLMLTPAADAAAGSIVVNGNLAGVAGACERGALFTLPVKGEGPSGNAAIAAGAIIYYDAGVLNADNTNGTRVGKTLDAVASGATTPVRVLID